MILLIDSTSWRWMSKQCSRLCTYAPGSISTWPCLSSSCTFKLCEAFNRISCTLLINRYKINGLICFHSKYFMFYLIHVLPVSQADQLVDLSLLGLVVFGSFLQIEHHLVQIEQLHTQTSLERDFSSSKLNEPTPHGLVDSVRRVVNVIEFC